jgi:hypoxanthine-DNA glycosylase
MNEIEIHPFDPFIPDNATTLIIGSFPGMEQVINKTNVDEWFYTAQDNLFWSILSSVYDKDLKTTEAKKELFRNEGIAITDIFIQVRRKERSNLDKHLYDQVYNDKKIKSILENLKIKLILFTGKYVEKHFQKKFPDIKNTVCLPSPSGAANIPISITEDYKKYISENPNGNTKTFRVYKYKELLKS